MLGGLAAIGVAVVLTMGECVSGIQLGIGKLGEVVCSHLTRRNCGFRFSNRRDSAGSRKCR